MAVIALWDYVVFFASVGVSLGIGIFFAYAGRTSSSMEDYFLAGRNLHYFPVAISLIVSFQSSVLMMGVPAEVYIYGLSHVLTLLGDLPCMLLLNIISVPLFYKLRLTSIYQYVKRRFKEKSETLRLFLVFLGMIFTIIYTALVLLGPAYALDTLTGFPVWVSILGSSTVAVIYTSIGGMRAVIWTDVFQFFIMLAGMFTVFVKGIVSVGGLGEVFKVSRKYQRMEVFDFNPDPWIRHSFWTLLIGSFFRQMLLLFSQQTMQRLNSTRTSSDAKKVVLIFIPFVAILQLVADGSGLVAFAFYANKECDPLASGEISNPNQIFILLMTDLLKDVPGVTGLVTAAILSASLSTVSSTLNGLAANTCEEFSKFKDVSGRAKGIIAKVSVILFGCLATLIALAMTFVKGSLSQIFISVLGSVGAPMVGMFLLAIFRKRIAVNSIIIGGLFGLVISLWMSTGYSFSSTLPETPWLPLGPTSRCTKTAKTSILNITGTLNQSVQSTIEPGTYGTRGVDMFEQYSTLNTSFGSPRSPIQNTSDTTNFNARNASEIIPDLARNNSNENKSTSSGLDKLYSISYQYFSVISTIVTIVVGSVVNTCLKRHARAAADDTVISIRQLCMCKLGRK